MELQLDLALPIHSPMTKTTTLDFYDCESNAQRKRASEEAFRKIIIIGNGHPNEDDDDDDNGKRHKRNNSCPIIELDSNEENRIIGWPPIKSTRKNELLRHHGTGHSHHRHVAIKKTSTVKIKVNAAYPQRPHHREQMMPCT